MKTYFVVTLFIMCTVLSVMLLKPYSKAENGVNEIKVSAKF